MPENVEAMPAMPFDRAAYERAQVETSAAALLPFDAVPVCQKCTCTGITSEYGTSYFVYAAPEEVKIARDKRTPCDDIYVPWPSGGFAQGPGYITRSCTNCKHAWTVRAADEAQVDV